jgi:hypothetical protein
MESPQAATSVCSPQTDPNLRTIPTAILTVWEADIDVETSYSLPRRTATSEPPLDLIEFKTLVRAINQFWMTMVTLPTPGNQR